MSEKSVCLAVLFAIGCARETVVHAQVSLQHHDIRADQLPPPFATRSSTNPPRVVAQPPGASLLVPRGFAISVFAEGLDDPRHMIAATNGDVLVSEPGAGKITMLRGGKRYTFASGLND